MAFSLKCECHDQCVRESPVSQSDRLVPLNWSKTKKRPDYWHWQNIYWLHLRTWMVLRSLHITVVWISVARPLEPSLANTNTLLGLCSPKLSFVYLLEEKRR